MNFGTFFRKLFLDRPTGPLPRWRLIFGCFGLTLLGVMVLIYVVAISVFLWADMARPPIAAVLIFLWAISAVAVYYIFRGLRYAIERLPKRPYSNQIER